MKVGNIEVKAEPVGTKVHVHVAYGSFVRHVQPVTPEIARELVRELLAAVQAAEGARGG